ncbi:hypothetical protein FQZ97_881220 [compost metagenome]
MGRGGDTAEQPVTAAGEIRQAGRAVIDQRSVVQVQRHCRAGVTGGQHADPLGRQPAVQLLLTPGLGQCLAGAVPAGQGLLVAVTDRHPSAADADQGRGRACGQAFSHARQALHGPLQLGLDRIGALDQGVIDACRVGAAATGSAGMGPPEFGFDIAA